MTYVPKILIVDDEPLMCSSLQFLLRKDGLETQISHSGREAMACFAKEVFDVVLLDIQMPDMNGLQLMDHMRSQCPGTFVVVITGHASVDSTVEFLRRGAFDYLRKPFEHEELLKTVNNALNQKRLEMDRKRAEEELRKAHEELERRVKERTAELAKANERLKREVEERKQAEKELQSINEEVKDFARVVSHDLKTPIISIQGFSSRLLKSYKKKL
ncbi:MAG: response regulator, partial [Desulfobacterales bacterium]|nr:response regulator [Desulfobacterales bacterium]